ncbi:MAG: flavodoxin domain-containing protein [Streptococcaceae bacterium]|jgi:hypothetical protein|nr:flavodoxin domain-containing protein [Streptococcaceae bacterium]
MGTLVVYASKHGTSKLYAEHFAKKGGLEVIDYKQLKKHVEDYDSLVFFGGVYFNKATGVKELLKVPKETAITFVSVGISGYDDISLKRSLKSQLNGYFPNIQFYHLRGMVDKKQLTSIERLIVHLVARSKSKDPNDPAHTDFEKIFHNETVDLRDMGKLDFVQSLQ